MPLWASRCIIHRAAPNPFSRSPPGPAAFRCSHCPEWEDTSLPPSLLGDWAPPTWASSPRFSSRGQVGVFVLSFRGPRIGTVSGRVTSRNPDTPKGVVSLGKTLLVVG